MSQASQPLVRSAVLAGFRALSTSLGVNTIAALKEAGISQEALTDPDQKIPVTRLNRLLEFTAKAARIDGVGLRLASHVDIDRLGLLGLLVADTATAGEAFDVVGRYSQLHNEALSLWADRTDCDLTVRVEYLIRSTASIREITEMTVGVIALNFRAIMGAGWNPRLVCLRHGAPADTRFHRQFFRCPIQFSADFDGLVCLASDFDLPNRLANQGSAKFIMQLRDRVAGLAGNPTLHLARRLIWALLASGHCTAHEVARLIGIDRRTLHRHLALQGESFSTLLDAIRIEAAIRHVGLGNRRLVDVAELLGFRSQSDFSHWFRHHFGVPPRTWRRQQPSIY